MITAILGSASQTRGTSLYTYATEAANPCHHKIAIDGQVPADRAGRKFAIFAITNQ